MPKKSSIIVLSDDEEDDENIIKRLKEKSNKRKLKKEKNHTSSTKKHIKEDEIEEFPSPKKPSQVRKRSNSSSETSKSGSSSWFTKKKRKSEDSRDVSDVDIDKKGDDDDDDIVEITPPRSKTPPHSKSSERAISRFMSNNIAQSSQFTINLKFNNNNDNNKGGNKITSQNEIKTINNVNGNSHKNSTSQRNNNAKVVSPFFQNSTFQLSPPSSSSSSLLSSFSKEREEVWCEKYAPTSENEVSIRKNKLSEVKIWLQTAIEKLPKGIKNIPKILILTGPCGAGKTAMIQVLSKSLNVELSEWIEPSLYVRKDVDDNLIGAESRIKKFKSFMLRSERYSSIPIISEESSPIANGKIIMIEQLPYLHEIEQRNEFNSILRDFLNSSIYPLVLIMSDDSSGSSHLNSILSTDVLSSNLVHIIHINCVVTSTILRILKSISNNEGLQVKVDRLQAIAEQSSGDIRSAINTLQFYSLTKKNSSSQNSSQGSQPKRKSSSRSKNNLSNSQDCEDLKNEKKLGLLGDRDQTLSLFHAIGKICYNKRLQPQFPSLQPSVSSYYRFPLKSKPEKILKRIANVVSPAQFNTFLHENYIRFFDDINDIASASLYLSDSDILDTSFGVLQRENSNLMSYVGLISTRGLLYSNTHRKEKTTFQQMFKPQSIKYRQKKLDLNNAINKLIVNSQKSSSEVRENNALNAPSTVLRSEVLPFVYKVRYQPGLQLTSGQTSLLHSLCTFYSSSSFDKLDKFEHIDEGEMSDAATSSSILTRNWLTKHQMDLKKREEEASILLHVGGKLNEVLDNDDIDDFED